MRLMFSFNGVMGRKSAATAIVTPTLSLSRRVKGDQMSGVRWI